MRVIYQKVSCSARKPIKSISVLILSMGKGPPKEGEKTNDEREIESSTFDLFMIYPHCTQAKRIVSMFFLYSQAISDLDPRDSFSYYTMMDNSKPARKKSGE